MNNVQYNSLSRLGYSGALNDMLLTFYRSYVGDAGSLPDAEYKFLAQRGFTQGSINDRWYALLRSYGYTGSITEMMYRWWSLFPGSSLALDFLSSTDTLDPRITFTRASNATRFNASGVLVSEAINTPRFDYDPVTLAPKGLLIEEQRTNSIRNNTMQGAVAGTPGTLPTNWTTLFNTTTGVNREVIGTGVEDGISYIDVRFSGTAVGAGSFDLFFEQANGVPALTGQPWSLGFFWRLVAGATTGLSSPICYFYEYTSTQGFVAAQNVGAMSFPSDLPLREQRVIGSATLSGGATTAFVRPLIKVNIANGAAIDITLRIGLPQLELGAFATSVIPTTTAAATRAADVAVMQGANFSNWYRQDEGTLFASYQTTASTNQRAFAVSDGTLSNVMNVLVTNSSGNGGSFAVTTAGSLAASVPSNIVTQSATLYQVAGSYKTDDVNGARNGVVGTTDTSATIPVVDRAFIGAGGNGSQILNGHIRRIAYFPRRLSNAELQGVTS